jgi:hypothetical protein
MSMGIEISPTRTWLVKHDNALANAAIGTPVEQLQKLKEALTAGTSFSLPRYCIVLMIVCVVYRLY